MRMTTALRHFRRSIIAPTRKTIVLGLRFNILIWTKYFDAAWAATPLHEKLTWILFISNTLAVLTLLQILAFK